MIVDSHCHLDRIDLTPYDGDLGAALAAARERGVERMLCVGVDRNNAEAVCAIAREHDGVYASVGIHPLDITDELETVESLCQLAAGRSEVVAIGETGLDYYRLTGDLEWQRERFRTHIRAARATGKPLIIHTRSAAEDTLRIMREEGAEEVGGVMHCFTETREVAEAALALNFHISFSGIVTFKNAVALQDVARVVPLERMLIETDSPYLAPVPHRGKTNEPAFVAHVAAKLAELRGLTVEQIGQQTTKNFFSLFKGIAEHSHV